MSINGFIFPMGTWLPNWGDPVPLTYSSNIRSIGGNWVAFDIYYSVATWTSTTISSTRTLSDDKIVAQLNACHTAGLKVAIKIHIVSDDGANQIFILPGAVYSRDPSSTSNPWTGSYRINSNLVNCAGWTLTASNIGDRIVTPPYNHGQEIPNSVYADQYGRFAAPAWTTITNVNNPGAGAQAVISTPATANSDTSVIAVLHDADANVFFTNFTTIIDHLMSITDSAGGIDGINLSTELDYLTRYYPDQFRSLIARVRTNRPNLLVWVNSSNILNYQGDVPFTDALDYLGGSFYPTVGTLAGNDSLTTMQTGWTTALAPVIAAASAWGKQILFGEVGARSTIGAAYQPYSSRTATAQNPAYDQSNFVEAFLTVTKNKSYFGGFFWWVWYGPPQSGETDATGSFAPKTLTQGTFSNYLLAPKPYRVMEQSGSNYLPTVFKSDTSILRKWYGSLDSSNVAGVTLALGDRWHSILPAGATPPAPTFTKYRPVSISSVSAGVSNGALTMVPTDANFVTFNVADTTTKLNTWLRTLGSNDIGVLPERAAPYLLDASGGFVGPGSFQALVRLTGRGIIGLGPGAVVDIYAGSYSSPQPTSGVPQSKAIETVIDNSYFGNFTQLGADLGGIPYHGIWYSGDNTTFERIFSNAAHRGFKNAPPGECGGICGNANTGATLLNCEIDCRDPDTGARVGSSPYMFNSQTNVTITDVYAHHSIAGMPTFYQVSGGSNYITRLRSEFNGSGTGGLNGSAHNFEQCTGAVSMVDSTLIDNYHGNNVADGTNNSGLHVSIGSNVGSMQLHMVNITHDFGPNGNLYFQLGSTYSGSADTQLVSDITVVTTAGNPVTFSTTGK